MLLTGAEIDQTAGLLTLRERQDVAVYGTPATLAALADNPMFGALGQCRVITVNGVPIRVTSGTNPDVGQMIVAVRFLEGGVLGVQAMQGQWVFESDSTLPPDAVGRPTSQPTAPKLTALPFTGEDLAALAADPAMLG